MIKFLFKGFCFVVLALIIGTVLGQSGFATTDQERGFVHFSSFACSFFIVFFIPSISKGESGITKAIGCFLFFVGMILYTNTVSMVIPAVILSASLFYAIPFIYRKYTAAADRAQWQKQTEIDRINRENAEEYAHQTALRRERERLEMHAEVRIREMITTLEAQYKADAQKMQLLSKMKAEFANRQQADLSSLLGQLEAMRAGA